MAGPNGRGEYLVQVGTLQLWTPSTSLEPSAAPDRPRKGTRRSSSSPAGVTPGGRAALRGRGKPQRRAEVVDLHGLRRDQAVEEIEKALDRALLAGCGELEIIHGIGSGTLQTAVHHYLSRSRHVTRYTLKPGNAGTTIAYL